MTYTVENTQHNRKQMFGILKYTFVQQKSHNINYFSVPKRDFITELKRQKSNGIFCGISQWDVDKPRHDLTTDSIELSGGGVGSSVNG